MIDNRWCRRNQLQIVFAFQTLLDDIHVEQSEKAAAKAKAECYGRFWFKHKRCVVDLHLFQRFLEVIIVCAIHRIKSAVDHWRDAAIPWQRLLCRIFRQGDRIADTHIADILQRACDKADLTDIEMSDIDELRLKAANIRDFKDLARRHHLELHALIQIEIRIENQRLKRSFFVAFRCGNVIDDAVKNFFDANACFCGSGHSI